MGKLHQEPRISMQSIAYAFFLENPKRELGFSELDKIRSRVLKKSPSFVNLEVEWGAMIDLSFKYPQVYCYSNKKVFCLSPDKIDSTWYDVEEPSLDKILKKAVKNF